MDSHGLVYILPFSNGCHYSHVPNQRWFLLFWSQLTGTKENFICLWTSVICNIWDPTINVSHNFLKLEVLNFIYLFIFVGKYWISLIPSMISKTFWSTHDRVMRTHQPVVLAVTIRLIWLLSTTLSSPCIVVTCKEFFLFNSLFCSLSPKIPTT